MVEDSGEREVRRGLELRGRVQGVGFRWWTRRTAESLGVRGTVRNRADGAVEVHLAGPVERVEKMTASLREGPSSARVEEVREIDSTGPIPDGFEIVR